MLTKTSRFVAYYRVSTRKQERSGLGIEAQRNTVAAFVASASGVKMDEFIEFESGKNNERPELQKALASCRIHRAVLVVAKLDRLARNAGFLLSLRDASVEIVACDLPSMNRMTVGIMAVVAEEEARLISERTKVALAAARIRGTKLGRPENLTDDARRAGTHASSKSRQSTSRQRARDLIPIFQRLQSEGCTSLRAYAAKLNAMGVLSPRGKWWTPMAVLRAQRTAATRVVTA